MMNDQAKTGVLGWPIGVMAFLYVVAAYMVQAFVDISRVNVILAMLLAFLLLCHMISSGRLSLPRYFAVPCAFLVFSVFSIFWAPDPSVAGWAGISTASTLLGALGIWVAIHNGLSWRPIAWACALGALGHLLAGRVLTGRWEAAVTGLGGRALGLAGNPNTLAMTLSYAALIMWCVPLKPPRTPRGQLFRKIFRGAFGLLGAGFIAYGVLFTGSRKMTLVIACVALLVLVQAVPKLKRPMTWFWLALGCWFAVVAYVLIDTYRVDVGVLGTAQSFQRMEAFLGGQTADRVDMIYEALELWSLQPLIGHGADQYKVLGSFQTYSHNNYTELLVNVGIVGFVLHYLLHALVLVCAFRGILRGSAQHRSAFVLVLTILLLDMAMVTYIGKVSWLFLVFVADLGLSRSTSRAASTAGAARAWATRRSPPRFSNANWHRSRLHAR